MTDVRNRIRKFAESTATVRPVDAFGINGTLGVRKITGTERDEALDYFKANQGKESALAAFFIAMCLVERSTGDQVYDFRNDRDIEELQAMPFDELKLVWDAAAAHNGMSDEDPVELAKKNSHPIPS